MIVVIGIGGGIGRVGQLHLERVDDVAQWRDAVKCPA
jgi:hypothetical protein